MDPGATHSFASKPFLDRFQIETQPLEGHMRVSLRARDLLFSDRVVRDSRILIGGQEFPADLVKLNFTIIFQKPCLLTLKVSKPFLYLLAFKSL